MMEYNRKTIDYCLNYFSENQLCYELCNGTRISFFEMFCKIKELYVENERLKANRDEVVKELEKFKKNAWSLTFYTKIDEFIEILERGKEDV